MDGWKGLHAFFERVASGRLWRIADLVVALDPGGAPLVRRVRHEGAQSVDPRAAKVFANHFVDVVRATEAFARHVCVKRLARVRVVLRVGAARVRGPAGAVERDELLLLAANELSAVDIEKAPEGVEGDVSESGFGDSARAFKRGAAVEDLQFVQVCTALVCLRELQSTPAFDGRPIGNGNRVHCAEATQDARQAKAEVRHFEERVVAIAKQTRVEFHDGAAPKVVAVFGHPLANVVHHVFHELAEVLRGLPHFGGVFREVLEHGPEVDERAPVQVPEVGEKQVRFEVVDELVVALEKEVAEAAAVRVVAHFALAYVRAVWVPRVSERFFAQIFSRGKR